MNYLQHQLKAHGPIAVGIVGCGIMGRSLLIQLKGLKAFTPIVHSSRHVAKVAAAFDTAGFEKDSYVITDDFDTAQAAFREGKSVITSDNTFAAILPDVVVDCTGDTNAGCEITLKALESNTHVVSLNVEMDATVGPYLYQLAKAKQLIYSGSSGDEPGAIIELYEFLNAMGFEVLVLGKGKNNPLNRNATNEELAEEAVGRGLNPRMLTSFVDGTNTMTELNAVCNATGFVPDIRGCHGFSTTPKTIAEDIDLASRGSKLMNYKVVDFSMGVAPGVFAIARTNSASLDEEMEYLSVGKAPNFAIYRPYHLTSLETPLSIIRAVVLHDASIAPEYGSVAETVTIAKRDLKPGELLGGIGSNEVYGVLETKAVQLAENLLPIGLITDKATAKVAIKKGTAITWDQVNLDESAAIVKVRRLQEKGQS
ncbi:NAD(P)-dependent oxidoreductase [Peptoniphilus equinus]|uniref:NAD(P)-dependent oxidoreductase n=1 Tax=Peptoniphilus equinus TaxID=3016343 RepID=A0ABY7QUL4_9FIRM|nr:NAD(P)-dependent oxidoreductase [Peptoniphilus equinus]WBW50479.1 NAD(P)-dependent oxidoreductase [Peptoniphilus equinus]